MINNNFGGHGGAGRHDVAIHVSAVARLTGTPEADLRSLIATGQLAAVVVEQRTYVPLETALDFAAQRQDVA